MPSKERFQRTPCGARFERHPWIEISGFVMDRLKLRELVLVIGFWC